MASPIKVRQKWGDIFLINGFILNIKKKSVAPFSLSSIHNNHSLVALVNLVDLIVTCIEYPGVANQTFLTGDGEYLSNTDLLWHIANGLGKPARLILFQVDFLTLMASLPGKKDLVQRFWGSLQVGISRARELPGWKSPVSV